MNAGPDVERRISDWLAEEVPTRAPDRILPATFERSRHTRQRRFGAAWRTITMNRTWQLATAAVVGGLFIGLGAVWLGGASGPGGQTPAASPTPSPTPTAVPVPSFAARFVSPLHGYSVGLPADWKATPATHAWGAAGPDRLWGSGINDEIATELARFSGASQALAPGQTADEWLDAYAGNSTGRDWRGRHVGARSSWPAVEIGGNVGYIDYEGVIWPYWPTVAPGGVMYDVVVVVDGRAYNFNMDGYVDRALFGAFLATVQFDAASAASSPPSP